MKIIVGLGNPGDRYKNTRHNLGFDVIDKFSKANNFGTFSKSDNLQSEFIKTRLEEQDLLVVKPLTYMNDSGIAVSKIVNFYKLNPENLILVHDDLDLDLGKIKIATKGSSAGHRGVQSTIDSLGTENFTRLRLGINHPRSTGSPMGVEDYVLERFIPNEDEIVSQMIIQALESLNIILTQGVKLAMNRFN